MLDIRENHMQLMSKNKNQENSRKREGLAMPRTQRLIIGDETAVFHAWDVEPNSPAILRFNHIML